MIDAGYHTAELVATLTGELFYASFGYVAEEQYEVELPNGLMLPGVRMKKQLRVL